MNALWRRLHVYPLLLLPGLILFSPLLFGSRAFADGDAVLQLYPALVFLKRSLQAGDTVVWNPHVMSGFVTAASLMGGWFSWLTRLAVRALPVVAAYNWLMFLNFALLAVFTYEFVQALGLRNPAAIFAGVVAPWIRPHFLWAANTTMTSSFFLMPALFFFCLVFSRDIAAVKKILVAIAGGMLVGTALHAAHLQLVIQTAIAAGLWALWLDFRNRRGGKAPRFPLPTVSLLLLTWAVAAAVAWPQLALVVGAKDFSVRVSQAVSLAEAQSGAITPADWLGLFFPNLSLPRGFSNPGFLYLGIFPLIFLLISLRQSAGTYEKFFRWLLLGVVAVSIKYSPVLFLFHQLPVLANFRAFSRWMYPGFFAAVVISAHGFERWLDAATQRQGTAAAARFYRISLWLVGLLGLLAVALRRWQPWLVAWGTTYFDRTRAGGAAGLPLAHYHQVIRQMIGQVVDSFSLASLPVLASAASLIAAAWVLRSAAVWTVRRTAVISVTLAGLNLVAVNGPLLNHVSAALITNPPPPVQYLATHAVGDFRVFTFLSGFTMFSLLDTPYGEQPDANIELHQNLLEPNLGMLWGVDSLDYYDNLMDFRHSRLLAYLGSNRSVGGEENLAAQPLTLPQKQARFLERLPLLGMLNVRYLISAYRFEYPDLTEVARWQATRFRIPLYLYELRRAKPRYYLTGDPVAAAIISEEESWAANLKAAEQGKTLVECDACAPAGNGAAGDGQFTVVETSNARYEFSVETPTPQFFVFGQNFLPGWHAAIDGKPVQIFRANYVNQAVAVPAGTHRLVFEFSK